MDRETLYYLLAYGAVFVVMLWLFKRRFEETRRTARVWKMFAEERGLSEDDTIALSFSGENEGLPFKLDAYTVRTGETHKTYTRMRVFLPDPPKGLHVYQETKMSRLGKALGAQDIEFYDPEFDKNFVVKGENPEEVRRYLTQERRHTLMQYVKDAGPIEIKDGAVILERSGLIGDIPELERLFSRVGDLAQTFAR